MKAGPIRASGAMIDPPMSKTLRKQLDSARASVVRWGRLADDLSDAVAHPEERRGGVAALENFRRSHAEYCRARDAAAARAVFLLARAHSILERKSRPRKKHCATCTCHVHAPA